MAVLFSVAMLTLSILMLWFGARYLVDSAARIAAALGVSDLVIGLTVVAFGTSAPEFSVTIGAAVKGMSDISASNIVGSNIFNLGLILGTVSIIRPLDASRSLVYRDGTFMILVTFLLLFFFYNLHLSRTEGVILMVLLCVYLFVLFIKREAPEPDDIQRDRATWKDFLILPAGIATVVAGGHFLVESATGIAKMIGISDWVIGVTIVAAGTSAPEMVTSIVAVIKGKPGMSAGNLIGSDIFNILGVLGLAGAINPLSISPQGLGSFVMLSGMVILVMILLRTGWKLSRFEGALLVCIGIARWVMDFI